MLGPDDHTDDEEEEDELRIIREVTAEEELDLGEQNALIEGAVHRNGVIRGKGHVIVRGEVLGVTCPQLCIHSQS
ncbi:MAG: hypothetical protein CME26_14805 [Gemmatimonadetes bacterium]|nr:hypothetical protein [Gemmatimonadota bacterium]